MKHDSPKYKQLLAFIDLVFNIMMAFAFLYVLSFVMINKPTKAESKIDPKAEAMIVMTWPDVATEDIDLWLMLPDGQVVSFMHRQAGLANLEKDDRGSWGDISWDAAGNPIVNTSNREVIMLRGLVPGNYQVSVHYYSEGGRWPTMGQQALVPPTPPYPVKVELIRLNPTYQEVVKTEVIVSEKGEEKSAFGFVITPDGKITDITKEDRPFVYKGSIMFPSIPGDFLR